MKKALNILPSSVHSSHNCYEKPEPVAPTPVATPASNKRRLQLHRRPWIRDWRIFSMHYHNMAVAALHLTMGGNTWEKTSYSCLTPIAMQSRGRGQPRHGLLEVTPSLGRTWRPATCRISVKHPYPARPRAQRRSRPCLGSFLHRQDLCRICFVERADFGFVCLALSVMRRSG